MPKPERTRPSKSELSTSSTPSMRQKSMTTASGKTSPLITSNVLRPRPNTKLQALHQKTQAFALSSQVREDRGTDPLYVHPLRILPLTRLLMAMNLSLRPTTLPKLERIAQHPIALILTYTLWELMFS
ncbi:hypothetical protein PCASD_26673 [Puccinia coronata f. sp. avenae]|uniref:Uncharacterized protein n=1 Tax=Puccinia coronata f. sp. avenae TaxID=200324 RepID=A0A2N5RZV0_9BASI|nr:hypothetical protein PCASD_26673 [Puccinia coronata f. sp. avenae]